MKRNCLLIVVILFSAFSYAQNEKEIMNRIKDSLNEFVAVISYVNDDEEPVEPSSIANQYKGDNYFIFNGKEMDLLQLIKDYAIYDLGGEVVTHELEFSIIRKKKLMNLIIL